MLYSFLHYLSMVSSFVSGVWNDNYSQILSSILSFVLSWEGISTFIQYQEASEQTKNAVRKLRIKIRVGIIFFVVLLVVFYWLHSFLVEIDLNKVKLGEDEKADTFYLFGQTDQNNRVTGYAITFDQNKKLKYKGYFKDGRRDGDGVYYWPENDEYARGRYEGKYKNGKREDTKGTLYWNKGNPYHYKKYVGEFREGQRTGYGVLTFYKSATMRKYMTRYGILVFTDDEGIKQYKGEFLNGEFHDDDGMLYYFDGARYQGGFVDGRKEGQGTYRNSRGNEYTGTFSFLQLQPIGDDNETYEGDCLIDFDQPIRCGRGVVSYQYDKYAGEFANNCKTGLGVYYYYDPNDLETFGQLKDRLYHYGLTEPVWKTKLKPNPNRS